MVGPGHPAYDEVRLLFNGMHLIWRPRLICLPRDVAELRGGDPYRPEAGLVTAVRGGGHNVAGYASVEDGLVIDLRLIGSVTVDPGERTAAVGGGATWSAGGPGEHRLRAGHHGRHFDTTGVGGLTLGGGLGHLMGRYGLTCDNVLSYQLVTAAGEVVEVDAERDPDSTGPCAARATTSAW